MQSLMELQEFDAIINARQFNTISVCPGCIVVEDFFIVLVVPFQLIQAGQQHLFDIINFVFTGKALWFGTRPELLPDRIVDQRGQAGSFITNSLLCSNHMSEVPDDIVIESRKDVIRLIGVQVLYMFDQEGPCFSDSFDLFGHA